MENQGDDAISFSSKGSTVSGWCRRKMTENDKRTAIWRQLYLSRAKLKAVSRTSALLAGFAMIAMVEVQLDSSVQYPPALLIAFSTVTTCLVAVHLFALMISTCLLPNIEAISNIHSLNAARYSPHVKMRTYIEFSWILSTGIGLVLFLMEIALLIWLKFIGLCVQNNCSSSNSSSSTNSTQECIHDNCINGQIAAGVATAVLIPGIILFAGFAGHFYRTLADHKRGIYKSFMREITDLEMRQDEMSCRLRQPSELDGGIFHHQDLSRMHSAASGNAIPLHTNGQFVAMDHLNTDSCYQEHENNNSGRTTPSVEVFGDK